MRNRAILFTELILGLVLLGSLAINTFLMINYTPKQLGPAVITFWFIGIAVFVASLITLLEYNLKLRNLNNRMQPRRVLIRSLRTGILLGLTITILLALSSLRSLSLRDIILFALTVLIIELYFRTRKVKP
jgi:FtsH-binding integral membrane protein